MLLAPLMMMLSVQAAEAPVVQAPSATSSGYGPAVPARPKPKAAAASDSCTNAVPTEPGEIVVCALKPRGYRIDPDVLTAKKALRESRKPKGSERFAGKTCDTVGPMGCRGEATVDLVTTAVVAATMLKKAASGENVAKMFVTNPQPTEYQLYLEAKRLREEKEAAAAAAEAQQEAPAPSGR